jgi:hypothetical protein
MARNKTLANSKERRESAFSEISLSNASIKKDPAIDDVDERHRRLLRQESVSELSDSEIPIKYYHGKPSEVVFADVGRGHYFGSLSLSQRDPTRIRITDLKEYRCFTSLYALQNTHVISLDNPSF